MGAWFGLSRDARDDDDVQYSTVLYSCVIIIHGGLITPVRLLSRSTLRIASPR